MRAPKFGQSFSGRLLAGYNEIRNLHTANAPRPIALKKAWSSDSINPRLFRSGGFESLSMPLVESFALFEEMRILFKFLKWHDRSVLRRLVLQMSWQKDLGCFFQ